MLPTAAATVFHRFMATGRTSPALFGCTHTDCDEESDYVVKLKGGSHLNTPGLVCEAVAAKLAGYFGILHPAEALIELSMDLANLIAMQEPEKASLITNSTGMNFGTKALSNLITWPVGRTPSASQFESAAEIFAFDALIQNADRCFTNPNLGSVGDGIYIFDHELAFSFRLAIFPDPEPWRLANQPFWDQHVFFNELKHKVLPLDNFTDRLVSLPGDFVDELGDELPADWDRTALQPIKEHLNILSANALAFRDEVTRRLI